MRRRARDCPALPTKGRFALAQARSFPVRSSQSLDRRLFLLHATAGKGLRALPAERSFALARAGDLITICRVSFHVVLVEPEIPPNTGNIARLCLAAGAVLHLIEPLGFSIDERTLRRAGMDYWAQCDVKTWKSFVEFQRDSGVGRTFFLTTKVETPYWEAKFQDGDALVFGRESRGLPESLLNANQPHCLTIPMAAQARSLNLATATGIVLYEAIRQTRCHQ